MLNDKIIVIDPGHSGSPDPGACGSFSKESTLAWRIACGVRGILVLRWGARVILTKQKENDPSSDDLDSRYNKANSVGADIFVSIHLNSAGSPDAHGVETYYSPGSVKGEKLADLIQTQLVACLGLTDRGLKTANYAVLRWTDMPAVLTEVCFISNPAEEQYINKSAIIQTAAEAIAQGIVDYFYT